MRLSVKMGLLIDVNDATPGDLAIQCQPATESRHDVHQDVLVLSERIRIECRHDTSAPQIVHVDDHVADEEPCALPLPLLETGDSPNDHVGPKSSAIASELRDRSVCRDQERRTSKRSMRSSRTSRAPAAHDPPHIGENAQIGPGSPVDQRVAALIECRVKSKQPRMSPRRDRAACSILYLDDAVTLDA